MAFDVGALVGRLKLDDKQFTQGIAKAKVGMKTVDRGMTKMAKGGIKAFRGITREVFSLKTALAGLAVGLVARNFTNVAASVEVFETQLTTTLGTLDKARERMEWIEEFAKTTPFEMPQLVEASVRLEAYGIDATKVMRTLGDTASAMGKDVIMAVEALADAQTGEFERLKEFGLKVIKEGGKDMILFTDRNGEQQKAIIDRNNREITTSTITAIWNEKYQGGMDRMSKTWSGMISNMGDHWFPFRNEVMQGGVFDFFKVGLRLTLDEIDRLKENGQLDVWAKNMATGVINALVGLGKVISRFPELWFDMVGRIKTALGFVTNMVDTLLIAPIEKAFELMSVIPGVGAKLADELATIRGIRFALQDTTVEFLMQGHALDTTGEKWAAFGQKVRDSLDKIREQVTTGVTPEVLRPEVGEGVVPGAEGGISEKEAIEGQIAMQERLRDITINSENARRKATIDAQKAILASRAKEITYNKLLVSSITTGLDFLVQAFPKLKGLAIGRATMNFGVALSEALKIPFPASIAAWGKVLALGRTALDTVKGARPGGGSTPSVSQTPIATVPQGVPEAAGVEQGGQNIYVTINALDPESVTEETAIRVVKAGVPGAFKAGGGVFDDVVLNGEER